MWSLQCVCKEEIKPWPEKVNSNIPISELDNWLQELENLTSDTLSDRVKPNFFVAFQLLALPR